MLQAGWTWWRNQAERALSLKPSSYSSQSNPSQSLTHLKKGFFSLLGTEDDCHCTAAVPLPNLNLPAKKKNTFRKVFSPILRNTVLKGSRERMGPRQTNMQRSPRPPPLPSPSIQNQGPWCRNPYRKRTPGWRHQSLDLSLLSAGLSSPGDPTLPPTTSTSDSL